MSGVEIDVDLAPAHARAAAILGLALRSGAPEVWVEAAEVWEAQLGPIERLHLLAHAIRAADFDEATILMDAAVRDRTVPPAPTFANGFGPIRDLAEHWATFASEAERKAWLLACFNSLSAVERVRFLAAAQRKALG